MRAVLFDVDGVLLDSTAAYLRVWSRWCQVHGLDFDSVWPLCQGRRAADSIAEVAPHLDPELEHSRLASLLLEEQQHLVAMAGVAGLLEDLPEGRWALVTSNFAVIVREQFARLGLGNPPLIVDGSLVEVGKPAPEGYLLAAARLGALPEECLVLEDSPAGVAAGLSAGMTVLALATTHAPARLTGAQQVLPSLAEARDSVMAWFGGGQGRPDDDPRLSISLAATGSSPSVAPARSRPRGPRPDGHPDHPHQ